MNNDHLNSREDANDFEEETISKSAVKREMTRLKELGAFLTTLTNSQLASITLPEKLALAIEESHNIKQNNARKRHFQFIGKLMRDMDIEQLESELNAIKEKNHRQSRQQPYIKAWTERLILEEGEVLQEYIKEFPNCEIQLLRQLIRAAKTEYKKQNEELKQGTQYIKLFKFIQKGMSDT